MVPRGGVSLRSTLTVPGSVRFPAPERFRPASVKPAVAVAAALALGGVDSLGPVDGTEVVDEPDAELLLGSGDQMGLPKVWFSPETITFGVGGKG